jgi:uncharacterized SAM-binding protein YcdF (DUF218 family)
VSTLGFALTKVATQLVYPLSLALALGLAALLLLSARRVRAAAAALTACLLLLWASSAPVVAYALVESLESRYPAVDVAALAPADAIVVLGGGLRSSGQDRPGAAVASALDRILEAARLYRAGKAPRVLASGGRMPWAAPEAPSGAEAMASLLREEGVPENALRLDSESRNTRENAVRSAAILEAEGDGRVLLVTSALHMRRALAAFRAAGVDAVPVPTDFTGPVATVPVMRWIPDAGALLATTRALKEYLGYAVYWARGWIVE